MRRNENTFLIWISRWSRKMGIEPIIVGIQTKYGTKFIQEVQLVPDLEKNLLSTDQLVEKWFFHLF